VKKDFQDNLPGLDDPDHEQPGSILHIGSILSWGEEKGSTSQRILSAGGRF
jgi:hypothetical protein